MNDAHAEIRKALEAGPTRGPWLIWGGTHLVIRKHSGGPDSEDLRICEVSYNSRRDESRHNTAFIAACHPEAIRALLAERDALYSALDRLAQSYRLFLSGKQVRDVPETLAQVDSAIAASGAGKL